MGRITHDRLLEILDYDRETGAFTWLQKHRKGQRAGHAHHRGRSVIVIQRVKYSSARVAWFYVTGEWPKGPIFPRNGNKLDLAFNNWRERMSFNHQRGREKVVSLDVPKPPKESLNHKYRLSHRFGITIERYVELLEEQKGVCAICLHPETSVLRGHVRRLAVDHDHKTGRVRALLCFRCNAGIGRFREDTEVLIRAASYLRQHALPDNVVPLKKEA